MDELEQELNDFVKPTETGNGTDITHILEKEIIANLLVNREYFNSTIHHLDKEYFTDPGISLLFNNIKDHYLNYQNIPSTKELILSFKDSTKQNKQLISASMKEINTTNTTTPNLNKDMLFTLTEKFIKLSIFATSVIKGADALSTHDEDLMAKSYALAEEAVKVSLNTDLGVLLNEIDKVFDEFKEKPGVNLNIPSFDKMIGSGFTPKTLHSAMAASGVGKSAAMTAFAVQFLLQKKDVVFITLEMSEAEVAKRIYSNLYDIDIEILPNVDKQVIKNKYNKIKDQVGELIIKEFPAGGLTPLGLEGFLAKLKHEKGVENPIVIVDYLGLMASDRMKNMDNSYAYFGSIAEELRAIAQKRNIVMMTPLQLNRSAINNVEADQSSLSESMKILMTLDSAFIISQTPDMKVEGKMKINFVKNRMSGKTYSFDIGFDYKKFRFDDRFFMGGSNITSQEIKDPLESGLSLNMSL